MIKELFSIFSIFDLFSPIITIYQDVIHLGTPTETIWLDKHDIGLAVKTLKKEGIKVISKTMVVQNDEGGISVESAQIGLIKMLLSDAGIETW